MAAVHEFRWLHAFVAHEKMLETFLVNGSDRLREVTKVFLFGEIDFFR